MHSTGMHRNSLTQTYPKSYSPHTRRGTYVDPYRDSGTRHTEAQHLPTPGLVTQAQPQHTLIFTWIVGIRHVDITMETHRYHSQWADSGLTFTSQPYLTRLLTFWSWPGLPPASLVSPS